MDAKKRTRITSIKVRRGVWSFAWEERRDEAGEWDKHTLVCGDEPRMDLLESMQAMARHVAEICELGQEAEKAVFVEGVKMAYKPGNSYLVLLAQKVLLASQTFLPLRTPPWPEHDEEGIDFCMSGDLVRDLRRLMAEAWRYIKGERAQQTLQFAAVVADDTNDDTDDDDNGVDTDSADDIDIDIDDVAAADADTDAAPDRRRGGRRKAG